MPDDQKPMLPKFMCRHCGFEVEAVGQPMCCGSNMAAHPNEWGRRQVALQPCGHPVSAVVSSDEGTAYCAMCEAEQPTCGIAGCVGKHHPQDHNATVDARACAACNEPAKGDATIDGERYCHEGASPTCYEKASRMVVVNQCIAAERDALRAELERVKAERNTIHDWYVDAKTENVALRAEVERMRPIVEAACDYMDTVGRYDTTGIHRTGKGSRARIRQCVDAYREDTSDE